MLAEVGDGKFAAGAEALPCLIAEFACAFRQRVASGVGEERGDVTPKLGDIVPDPSDQVSRLAVFDGVQWHGCLVVVR